MERKPERNIAEDRRYAMTDVRGLPYLKDRGVSANQSQDLESAGRELPIFDQEKAELERLPKMNEVSESLGGPVEPDSSALLIVGKSHIIQKSNH